jgi:hypothetical protein
MELAKLKSTTTQAVPSGALTQLLMTTEVLQTGTEVIGTPASSSIQLTKAGYYLVSIEVFVVGSGQHQVYLTGNGFVSAGTEILDFTGTADGVCHGMSVLVRAGSATFFVLKAIHNAGANRNYQCAFSVNRMALA